MQKLVAEIPKSSRETLRIELSEFKGHQLVSLRLYVPKGDNGEMVPTPKGITFKVDLLPQVAKAIAQAEKEARESGLLSRG